MEFTITSGQILGFCGLITSLWAVYKVIKEVKKPSDELKEKVEEHDERLKTNNETLAYLEEATQLMLHCQLVMIEHDITKNGYPQLEESRDKLHEFLIKK